MRVAWVSHSAELGGAELSLWEGALALARRGVDVHAVLPKPGPLAARLEEAGIRVSVTRYPLWVSGGQWRTTLQRAKRSVGSLAATSDLARALASGRPDLVVTNTLAVGAGALASRRLALPHVWYVHEFGEDDHGLAFDLPRRIARRMVVGLSDRLIVNSRAVRRAAAEWVPLDRMHVVYYGVAVSRRSALEPGSRKPLRLAMVGRMSPGKRQEDAVKAVALLEQRGIDVRLDLVGGADAAYGDYVQDLAGSLDVAKVRFLPFTPDRLTCLANADVALMCSSSEAFGRVTVEAMKVGRPVVGARAGGTMELVREGFNGLLYRPGDPVDLASKIETLWLDRPMLRAMGRNAAEWSRTNFSLERYADGLASVFGRALLAGGNGRP